MSTNSPSEIVWGPAGALPPGLPDPDDLARLAAGFFGALPRTEGLASTLDAVAPGTAMPPVPAAFGVSPGPVQLESPVASPAVPLSAVPAPVRSPGVALPEAPASRAFSFLQGARPIFAGSESVAAPALPEVPLASPPAHLPETGGPPTPGFPGGLGAAESAFPVFSFIEDARPIFSQPPSAPGPAPAHQTSAPTPEFPPLRLSSDAYDVETIRRDFPILREQVNGRPLVWLDNGATTQKPQSVIDRLSYFYAHENSNVHRAAHELAARATDAYESAREKVRRFLNAAAPREIIFVRGATEAINLVAQSWGRQNIAKDDEIVISWLEHHANIVPWQMLCSETGAHLRVAPVDDTGQIILEEYEKLLGPKTRLVSITQVSNALGTVAPVRAMIEAAHRHGARVLVDGAQAVSHMRVDVQSLDCDFYVFSGHKLYAPTGIGVVYGKQAVLDTTGPWQGGGNMIQDVTFEKTIYNPPPARFEAGTGSLADAVGLGAAIDYLDRVGMENVARREIELLHYGTAALNTVPGLRIIGTAREKVGVLSFVMDGIPTEEIGDYLNREGIAVRAGHHCAQPILRRFGVESTVRATLALYNTCEDIDALAAALQRLRATRRRGN
jgi:cysteine desulfurase / selenocysteine lyase